MKVGIITMAYGINYGNRLQNYAMQELLRDVGVSAETIRHTFDQELSIPQKLILFLKKCVKRLIRYDYESILRDKRFRSFDKSNIQWGEIAFGTNSASAKLVNAYDYFIVGSDQVWNARFGDIKRNINIFLASFAPSEKRIAYAASFGTSEIAPGYEEFFQSELPKFKAISVREQEGVRLVEQCGAKAIAVLDPTMMRTRDQWDKLAKKPKFISDEHYVVTYFLGRRDETMSRHIESVAGERRIIHLNDKANINIFSAPPDEFVWVLGHSDCVLTDSFHGSVFSILYHKPFMVFERLVDGKDGGMGSRIDTLLGTFHLEQCRGDIHAPGGTPMEGDWEQVEAILAEERKKSLAFLKHALDME